jgi:hypothetical protein
MYDGCDWLYFCCLDIFDVDWVIYIYVVRDLVIMVTLMIFNSDRVTLYGALFDLINFRGNYLLNLSPNFPFFDCFSVFCDSEEGILECCHWYWSCQWIFIMVSMFPNVYELLGCALLTQLSTNSWSLKAADWRTNFPPFIASILAHFASSDLVVMRVVKINTNRLLPFKTDRITHLM